MRGATLLPFRWLLQMQPGEKPRIFLSRVIAKRRSGQEMCRWSCNCELANFWARVGLFNTPPFLTMLTLILSTLVGVLIPWIVFSEKDKSAPDGTYTLGRLAFVGWFFGSFFITLLIVFVVASIENLDTNSASSFSRSAWGLSLVYIVSRRLRDVGRSPWWSLLGLLFPLMLAGHILFMFVPGKRREAVAAAPKSRYVSARPKTKYVKSEPGRSVMDSVAGFLGVPESPRTAAMPPEITLLQGGSTYGPYPPAVLCKMWDDGEIAGNALYWHESLPEYRPLAVNLEQIRRLA